MRRRRGGAGARLRRARRPRLRPGQPACPSRWASSATTMSGRTFIQPTQGARELGVRMKLSPNRAVLAGKRVMLIDDFDRARHQLGAGRADGARGRRRRRCTCARPRRRSSGRTSTASTCPTATSCWPPHHSLEEMAKLLEVDSLGFLSVDGLYWAMDAGPRDPGLPAVHRPLFHRRLPHPPARPRDRRGPQRAGRAPAVVPGRRVSAAAGCSPPEDRPLYPR